MRETNFEATTKRRCGKCKGYTCFCASKFVGYGTGWSKHNQGRKPKGVK